MISLRKKPAKHVAAREYAPAAAELAGHQKKITYVHGAAVRVNAPGCNGSGYAVMEFKARDRTPLTEANLEAAAKTLGCEVAAIKAVSEVEAPNGGFIPDGRPELLFESHTFHEQTAGKYDASLPGISTATWVHNYGAEGAHQYDRLGVALRLNREAALKSASWGKYQIMGFNYVECGYDNVEALVADLCDSEAYQLDAFVAYMQNTACGDDLVNKDWSSFALHYNGPGQVSVYAAKIEEAYRRFS